MTPQKLPRHDWLIPEVALDFVRQAAALDEGNEDLPP